MVHDVASEIVRIDHVQLLLPSRRDDLSDAWKFQDSHWRCHRRLVIERASAEREIVEALDEIGAVGGTDVGLPAVLEPDADPVGVASIGTAAGGLL